MRALALLLAVSIGLLSPLQGRAETTCDVTQPPERSARLRLRAPGEVEGTLGIWLRQDVAGESATALRGCLNSRDFLESELGTCRGDLAIKTGEAKLSWKWWALIIAGVAAGSFAAGKKLSK